MEQTQRELFENYWEKFITRLKGKMMIQSDKQALTYPLLKLLLTDASLSWASEYEEGGRWLRSYTKQNPEKGYLLHRILLEDMSFTEIPVRKDISDTMNYVVPAAGAVAGLCVSSILKAGLLVKAVSTIAPAVILYPSAKTMGENRKEKYKKDAMKEYLSQLEKFKQSVISVLDNE